MSIFTTFRFDWMESRCRLVTSPMARMTRRQIRPEGNSQRAARTCLSPELESNARVGDAEYDNRTDVGDKEEDPFKSRCIRANRSRRGSREIERYFSWLFESLISQLRLTTVNDRIAGDETKTDKIHMPQRIRIVCLWVNLVRRGYKIAKYLFEKRMRSARARDQLAYRSKLIAT